MKFFLVLFFLVGLIYLIIPGPSSKSYFPKLPKSITSTESGDTWQNPNNVAYYSSFRRSYVTNFYRQSFEYLNILGFRIPPIILNHPPEEAFQYIRDQQQSTYLEEYFYPFRDTLFVNGYEPIDQNGKKFSKSSVPIQINTKFYASKTTLRYYPSNVYIRVLIYLFYWFSGYFLFVVWSKKKV